MRARQGHNFHFRRRVPDTIRPLISQRELWAALGTSAPTTARAQAGRL